MPKRLLLFMVLFAACGGPGAGSADATDPSPALAAPKKPVTAPPAPVVPVPTMAAPRAATVTPDGPRPRVIFDTPQGEVVFLVEVARTEEARRTGLMHRRSLDPGRGMLFLMDFERQQVFWMKNTLIPLDMIFVNEALEVVGVVENAIPLDETPRGVRAPSRWVVEIPGGHARPSGIAAGARMRVADVGDFPPKPALDDDGAP